MVFRKFLLSVLLVFVLIGASVFAFQGYSNQRGAMMNSYSSYERGTFHDDVEKVLEEGTYGDLLSLREELGFEVMRRVQSQEDFEFMQQRHEQMESYYKDGGSEPSSQRGMMDGNGPSIGNRGYGSCHMFN